MDASITTILVGFEGFRPCSVAGKDQISPTAFPGRLNGYRFFSLFLPRSGASQSDQFLDNGINRLKSGEVAFGDDAVTKAE